MPNAWRMSCANAAPFLMGLVSISFFYTRLTGFHKNNFYQLAAEVFSMKKAANSAALQ